MRTAKGRMTMSGSSLKRTMIAISAALTVSAVTVGATVSPAQAGTSRSRGSRVDKIEDAGAWRSEAPVPTDLLAGLLMERGAGRPAQRRQPGPCRPKSMRPWR